MTLTVAPISITEARRYIGAVHRHNLPPRGAVFAVAAKNDDTLVGVAVAGRPVARMLDDGETLEVTRLATDGTPNACSLLYGACSRAAKALGYRRIYTYTLQREHGASLRASGWTLDAELDARPSWDCASRPRVQTDLFGNDRRPSEPKYRWVKQFGGAR